MKEMVERCLVTVGKDENQTGMVVFPYNEEDVLERFGVETTKELKFVDHPESKVSVAQFNYIIGESEARSAKIEEQINASVRFLINRLKENPEWKGTQDTVPLGYEDAIIWNWCMKEDYHHPDEKVKVWYYGRELKVFYGEKNNDNLLYRKRVRRKLNEYQKFFMIYIWKMKKNIKILIGIGH